MQTYVIYPLVNLLTKNIEQSSQTYLKNYGCKLDTPVVFWLVQGGGRNILVDSGACDPATATKNHHKAIQTPDMEPLALLAGKGVGPDDIDTIVLTHLHWDHCFNLELFPKADIYVQEREVAYAANPLPDHHVFYEGTDTGLRAPWLDHQHRFTLKNGDYSIGDGLDVHFLPGHTPGMQGLTVTTADGVYLVASDNVPSMLNWNGIGKQRHIPSALHNNLHDYHDSFAKMEAICDYVIPSHDPAITMDSVYPDAPVCKWSCPAKRP
ncbi:MAG: N-acyl homoserine lactonase family protein [Planctomycetes bacterium]|nr:N-acyl homoserine lactonase family protein [Planctomycetota bacterium]